jgi:hypothetical protein
MQLSLVGLIQDTTQILLQGWNDFILETEAQELQALESWARLEPA